MPKGGKKSITYIVLVIWVVFSVLYVGFDVAVWTSKTIYKNGQRAALQQAYNTGRSEAVKQVIQEAQKCQSFPVNVGKISTNLISVECLQAAKQATEAKTSDKDATK